MKQTMQPLRFATRRQITPPIKKRPKVKLHEKIAKHEPNNIAAREFPSRSFALSPSEISRCERLRRGSKHCTSSLGYFRLMGTKFVTTPSETVAVPLALAPRHQRYSEYVEVKARVVHNREKPRTKNANIDAARRGHLGISFLREGTDSFTRRDVCNVNADESRSSQNQRGVRPCCRSFACRAHGSEASRWSC